MKSIKSTRALGAFFVSGLAGLAIAGCGSGVPGNAVVNVAGNPITTSSFNHWLYVYAVFQSSQSPGAPVIIPDAPNFTHCISQLRKIVPPTTKITDATLKSDCNNGYKQLRDMTLDNLIREYWYQAYAASKHVKVTDAEVNQVFQSAKKQQFQTEAQFLQYLSQSGQTLQDVLYNIRVNQILKKLVTKQAGTVTPAQVSAFYTSHKSQFGAPETRNLRIVLTKTQGDATTALKALQKGGNWNAVAKQYSIDTTTKNSGGVITAQKGRDEAALDNAAFAAPKNKLIGPVKGQFGYYVLEVTGITAGNQQSLAQATAQIQAYLSQQAQNNAKTAIDAAIKKKYLRQTQCRSGFLMSDCSGYKAPKTATTATTPQAPPSGTATVPPQTGTATVPPTTTTH
jgi:foldase protein PrsA